MNRQNHALSKALESKVEAALDDWQAKGNSKRLWNKDATLWTGDGEGDWLGWLDLVSQPPSDLARLRALAEDSRTGGFSHLLLLGMGGSSLCPEVLKKTFGKIDGFPELFVLDSTDPGQVRDFEETVNLERTLFIVSSKSGTTLEPNIFLQYFLHRVKAALGEEEAGSRFVAVTDPGSHLEELAQRERFRHVFHGLPTVGGRFSALSNFGLVPASLMGLNLDLFLERAGEMVQSCAPSVSERENPGVALGAILGTLADAGRDKVTIFTSPGIGNLGAWLEQLLAESTGKQGKALIPVDGETAGKPELYSEDRLFVYLNLEDEPAPSQNNAVEELEQAGHPVVRITLRDRYDLSQEFFRWEIATSVAGSIMGINPFDQPDVEASKIATRKLTDECEKSGTLPLEKPVLIEDGISLFTDERNRGELEGRSVSKTVGGYLKAHLERTGAGDYVALLAYLHMNDTHIKLLQRMRHHIRDARRLATCLGFGPRFLHSTGQAYKGGPDSGVFLQITSDDAVDLPVPGKSYTFGVVKSAQARGDFEVLAERGRRALRVHLGKDTEAHLKRLLDIIEDSLSDGAR